MEYTSILGHISEMDVDGRIILIWIFRKWDVGGVDWVELAQVAGTYECGNEPSGSIKCEEFLD
jgi:hypothetical protein